MRKRIVCLSQHFCLFIIIFSVVFSHFRTVSHLENYQEVNFSRSPRCTHSLAITNLEEGVEKEESPCSKEQIDRAYLRMETDSNREKRVVGVQSILETHTSNRCGMDDLRYKFAFSAFILRKGLSKCVLLTMKLVFG